MGRLEQQLNEDRAMRDAARRLLEADLGFVKSDVHDRGVGERTVDRLREGSLNLADSAMDYARGHPLLVFGGLSALLLVLFRNSVLDWIIDLLEDEDKTVDDDAKIEFTAEGAAEPDEPQDRSKRKRMDLAETSR